MSRRGNKANSADYTCLPTVRAYKMNVSCCRGNGDMLSRGAFPVAQAPLLELIPAPA